MSNQAFYILSEGIGEIEFDKEENKWYKMRASEFNEDKTIPLLINLVSICSKYWRNQARNARYERYPNLVGETSKKSNGLAKSYALIEDYTEELFCTGDIHTKLLP